MNGRYLFCVPFCSCLIFPLSTTLGEAYLPFAEMPNLRNAVLTGDEHDDSIYLALTGGQGHIPITDRPHGNDVPFRPSSVARSGFKPVHD